MNILIVDDDAYIIRAIKSQINWVDIGIDNVFTALNVCKAKEIIKEKTIDVMVTDIEMPQENGLELMRWTLKEGYHPEAICLTCHAEFAYAREAIQLGYSEYCVKPIEFKELEAIIENTVLKCKQKIKKQRMETEGVLWEKNKRIVASDFWNNLIRGQFEGNVELMIKQATQKKVDYHFESQYQCTLFAVCSIQKNADEWKKDKDLMKYALYNILSEKFPKAERSGMIGWYEDYLWIIIEVEDFTYELDEIEDYLNVCRELLSIDLAAYVSDKVFGENLGIESSRLINIDRDNIRRISDIYLSNHKIEYTHQDIEAEMQFDKYKNIIENNNFETFFEIVTEDIKNKENLNREILEGYIINIFQLLSSKLLEMKIQADTLFDKEMILYMKNASNSVDAIFEFLEQLKIELGQLSDRKRQESKIINNIKEYILANIESKLTRKEIADKIFLSPDYLTKLFRKETGMTLIEYVTEEKVNVAKKMIMQERIPIGEVAQKLGYENFSYFSEIFRKKTGKSPSEYKK